MRTSILVPFAQIEVHDARLYAQFDEESGEIAELSELVLQLRQVSMRDPLHGLFIATPTPSSMWTHGEGLFYRLLFTINGPGDKPGYMKTLLQYEVKVYRDRADVIAGWNADKVFPILATVYYGTTKEFNARPLFEGENPVIRQKSPLQ